MARRGGASQTNRAWRWEELAAETLRRQFPRIRGRGQAAVAELIRAIGPVQSQAARAPFVCVASRLPGATYDAITAAHESFEVLRSTSLRGTVHTSTRAHHAPLAAVARRTLLPQLRRMLRLSDEDVDAFRAELERLSANAWIEHVDLVAGISAWLRSNGHDESVAALETAGPRYTLRGHPAMLRRPRGSGAGWESQAEVVYRSARFAVDETPVDPQEALVALVRSHVAASGPVTRRDLAWWSGDGLRNVDAAVAALGSELDARVGPNGLDYLDLAEPPGEGIADAGVRLLPEYDALLLAYDPAARDRFADREAVSYSWNRANGVHSPTVLVDGRLRGRWRLTRSGRSAVVEVEMFPRERLLEPSEFADRAAAAGAALGLTVSDVRVTACGG